MKKTILISILTGVIMTISTVAAGQGVRQILEQKYGYYENLYQNFHRNPELAHQEKETSAIMADELRKLGFDVTTGVGGYGVVGVFKNGSGKTVLIRADMDALPIQEETGLPYQSQNPNAMHACGHDIHMSIFLGTAYVLMEQKDKWKGTLVAVAQPAEEVGEGAKAMIDAGLFKKFPRPDYALAIHVGDSKPAGVLSYHKGYSLANVDYVDIAIFGRGGHGAMPHITIDPIVLASQIVLGLQTLVSREMNPIEPAVVTVGSINGGTKYNIIPEEVKLQITVRSFGDEQRQHLKEGIYRIAEGMAQAARAPKPKIEYREGVDALYNDPNLVDELIPVFEAVAGKENVSESMKEMYGEDFSFYGRGTGVPIFMFWVGSRSKSARSLSEMHTPRYAPDFKGAFMIGATAMAEAVIKLQSD